MFAELLPFLLFFFPYLSLLFPPCLCLTSEFLYSFLLLRFSFNPLFLSVSFLVAFSFLSYLSHASMSPLPLTVFFFSTPFLLSIYILCLVLCFSFSFFSFVLFLSPSFFVFLLLLHSSTCVLSLVLYHLLLFREHTTPHSCWKETERDSSSLDGLWS